MAEMEKTHLAIIEFLAHNCAEDIARTFYDELDEKPEFDFDEIFRRKAIRETIEAGELEKALDLLSGYYPTLTIQQPSLHIDILIARLVASIQSAAGALDVVTTARSEIVPVIERLPKPEDRQEHLETLNKAMSLLIRADADPSGVWSPTSIYVSPKALARSIEERLVDFSGSKPHAETRLFDQLLRIHQWAEREEVEERERRNWL